MSTNLAPTIASPSPTEPAAIPRHRVVIIGGGFGGLNAALSLRRAPVDITLIDRRNFHLFQPLLYQVATGGLSPANIAAPLRSILERQRNCRVLMGDVTGFDLKQRIVRLVDGEVPFDSLIVATGSQTGYFGRDDWAPLAPGLKTIEDAIEIRRRVLTAFEHAERTTDPEERTRCMTFVVVGGGPTGVELAGTLAEIARDTLRHEFRRINPTAARIVLIDASETILSNYAAELSAFAADRLHRLGVELQLRTKVTNVTPTSVSVHSSTGDETIAADTILWAAGVRASPLGRQLAAAWHERRASEVKDQEPTPAIDAATILDRAGRVRVAADCSLPGCPEVFVIGDLAHYAYGPVAATATSTAATATASAASGSTATVNSAAPSPLPGVAPVAIQQGQFVARTIVARLKNQTPPVFRYLDYGNMATIGRSAAIAELFGWRFTGFIAWSLWLFVHLIQLVSFESRILVLIQWAWNYMTFDRSSRLITGRTLAPEVTT